MATQLYSAVQNLMGYGENQTSFQLIMVMTHLLMKKKQAFNCRMNFFLKIFFFSHSLHSFRLIFVNPVNQLDCFWLPFIFSFHAVSGGFYYLKFIQPLFIILAIKKTKTTTCKVISYKTKNCQKMEDEHPQTRVHGPSKAMIKITWVRLNTNATLGRLKCCNVNDGHWMYHSSLAHMDDFVILCQLMAMVFAQVWYSSR